ncbi:hypothetical protein EBM89_17670 [Cellulomonas triticagri]|uniref:Uncharacterized protein n=2 Tax=Cellulomonas triticagri TaxID=2483352 RepID=A0A3M2IUI3_9CELL|nr:hypothetical protein EBM89_17670 [Cellulomonas triticagri]
MASGVGSPGRGAAGSASAPPESGVTDVTVLCSSVQARPADLVVRSGGEVVGETTALCSDAADPDADPVVTVLPDVPITGAWSFDLVPETTAATAVIVG